MNKKLLTRCAAALLLLPLIVAVFLTPTAAEEQGSIDLSRPASSHNVTVPSADIVEYFIGEGISDEERAYLARHGGVTLKYEAGITTSYVVTDYSDGRLTVIAQEYSYVAADGTRVTWLPSSVTVGDATHPLTLAAEGYTATLLGVPESDSTVARITYTLDISVPTETVNRLINLAYNDLPAVREEIERGEAEHDRLYSEYEAGRLAYEEYLAAAAKYEADLAAYTNYLSEKKIYEDAKAEYDRYLVDLGLYEDAVREEEIYKAALAEYNAALAKYNEYVAALDLYDVRLAEYHKYLSDIATVREQIAAMDVMFTKMTDLNRSAYNAIMGNLVTEVLEGNRDLFEGIGFKVDTCLIDDAAAATYALRDILTEYKALEAEADKYQFYISNYEAFRDNVTLLLQSLDELYNYDKIRTAMNAKDATYPRKYEILVAQLAICANALTDGPVYAYWGAYHDTKCTNAGCTLSAHKNNRYVIDENTKIHKTSVKDVLGDTYITDTDNSTPLPGGMPVELTEPTIPTPVTRPTNKPVAPTVPAKPDEVKDPGEAPTEVSEPVAPTEVSEPVAPTPFVPDPVNSALVALYDRGGLREREELTSEARYTARATVDKRVFGVDTVTVFFFDLSGNLLYRTEVDSGTRADYVGEIPEKAEDISATYTFSHWVDADGAAHSLSSVDTDLALYPAFTATPKSYDITFNVDGVKTVVPVTYGSLPEFRGTPARPDDEYCEYSFAGWDRQITPVEGPTEYRATFTSRYIMPLNNGGARITDDGNYIIAECADPFTYELDLSPLISRATEAGNMRGIRLDTRVFDITVAYQTLLEMKAAGDTTVTLNRTRRGDYTWYYTAKIGEGSYRVSATVPCELSYGRQLRLYYMGGESEKKAVLYTYDAGSVAFTMNTGVRYTLAEEYELDRIENPLVGITVLTGAVARGDRVELSVDIPVGVSLDRLYLVYPDGSETDVSPDGFDMPDSDVTLCAAASYIEYKITFMNGEKIIVTFKHRYGDAVTPPSDPTRPNSDTHRYRFVGWSERITEVTEDKTYYALFEAIPLPKREEPTGIQISEPILGLIVAGIAFVSMMVLAVIPVAVLSVILVRRERKRYRKKGD